MMIPACGLYSRRIRPGMPPVSSMNKLSRGRRDIFETDMLFCHILNFVKHIFLNHRNLRDVSIASVELPESRL
jgi:hypothetical protein